eukprot:CAMPEP_0195008604 /NCGR_PEP_ID=MMETSP0326_2-20130528/8591_1 /TAXON_ID=2866 ORGANISM="Crypthecodinium cohnii, Strain Seligo" /NCGR_SAMPLE_ID=MMETSP0326_2 /ASSEMBLY_ACC=CAM_ASM_000348 /LENGTH=88 /DNA_ID=CAMNT_0040016467 /DNA_START=462 /DNA_END=725 /DNA_ORIENTATION=-
MTVDSFDGSVVNLNSCRLVATFAHYWPSAAHVTPRPRPLPFKLFELGPTSEEDILQELPRTRPNVLGIGFLGGQPQFGSWGAGVMVAD